MYLLAFMSFPYNLALEYEFQDDQNFVGTWKIILYSHLFELDLGKMKIWLYQI